MRDKEDQYLRQLLTLLESTRRLETYTQDDNGQWQVQPRSALAGDDAKSHPHEISHSAWHALTVPVDHLQCLRSSILAEQNARHANALIHTHAQASLVRGAFENSARTVWLLGPANRLQRLTRGLSLQAKEIAQAHRVRELAKSPGVKTKVERLQVITDLLVAAGASPEEARKALKARPAYKQIVREAGQQHGMGDDLAELIWSACSSLAHGDIAGTLAFLDREIIESDGTIALARITGSISLLFHATFFAVQMVEHGVTLYQQRAAAHV
ncbi:hypothetical protein [Streptomyces venezuelae]|uniref:hypothetical protein n=1 Tax=Streptomyces venezuelae TaxID=54571 RepID=UPI0037D51269